MDKEQFKIWLINEKGFSDRVTKDIVSRLTRSNGFINASNIEKVDEKLMLLERDVDFQKLSKTVKSQLRRSIRLEYEYLNCVTTS